MASNTEPFPTSLVGLLKCKSGSLKYMFELANINSEREMPVIDMVTKRAVPHKKFKPFQNMVFTSQVVWKGQRRMLRYYDGCTSIFQDKQPKDKETIDQLISQTNKNKYKTETIKKTNMIEIIKQPWHWALAGVLIGLTVPLLLLIGNKKLIIKKSMHE